MRERVYAEAGGTAKINRVSIGAGTDAAFAALRTEAPVLEGLGLRNFGAHSNNAEYVNISSIEPRLYLVTRLIVDISTERLRAAISASNVTPRTTSNVRAGPSASRLSDDAAQR